MSTASVKKESSLSIVDGAKPATSKVSSLMPRIKKTYSEFDKEIGRAHV